MRYRVDLGVRVSGHRLMRPDIVFTRSRVCCFIDGCWWHGCADHGRRTTAWNFDYWSAKIARNIERDEEQSAALQGAGWMVLRFWEHDDPAAVADAIAIAVRSRS